MKPQSLPWTEPLALASTIDQSYWVMLYSAARESYSGRYSYIACDLVEHIESSRFDELEAALARPAAADGPFAQRWFGYLGYGLKNTLETLPQDKASWPGLPALCMMRFDTIYLFDHQKQSLTCWSRHPIAAPTANIPLEGYMAPPVKTLDSPMSDEEYLQKAAHIIEQIHQGELYQANLTRKYQGEFTSAPDYFELYRRLCDVSPAPYSAYLRLGQRHILSSSPELFLSCTPNGYIKTRPIKGSASRHGNAEKDRQSALKLAESPKDRAENLMITDLMRNDLSRCCTPGSVKATSLFEVTSHATIHHMSSTVEAQKSKQCSTVQVIKACFPPGSMTGAPKIHAMRLCSALEELERGVYSGAIGWLDHDGSCELSVVIRTLVMEGAFFEFQVGGGIVADSTPEGELEEIAFKANGIMRSLGLDNNTGRIQRYSLNA